MNSLHFHVERHEGEYTLWRIEKGGNRGPTSRSKVTVNTLQDLELAVSDNLAPTLCKQKVFDDIRVTGDFRWEIESMIDGGN